MSPMRSVYFEILLLKQVPIIWVELTGLLIGITDPAPWAACPCLLGYALTPAVLPTHRGGENEKEEEEVKRYQEFQKRQVQSLLELKEAQADIEAERRLEHLRQVRWLMWRGGTGCLQDRLVISPCHLMATCVHRLSNGSGRLSWMLTQLRSKG